MPDLSLLALQARLHSERARLDQAIAALSSVELEQARGEGWSGKDILAHLVMAEKLNVKFARAILEQDNPAQVEFLAADVPDYAGPFALDDFNAHMHARLASQSLSGTLAELRQVRTATLAWIDTLKPNQLERRGIHAAWGELTLAGMLRILALHDKMHAGDLARLQGEGPKPAPRSVPGKQAARPR